MALGGAALPPADRVGILELAAAWVRLLHWSVEGTYLAVPILIVSGLDLRVDALVALVTALLLHLVLAHDPRVAAAAEASVGSLAVLVAVHEELGHRIFLLQHLTRLFADIAF